MFKHKVFVDNAGILFADGDFSKQIASDFKVMSGDLSQIIDGTTTIGQVVGNTDIKNASTTTMGGINLWDTIHNVKSWFLNFSNLYLNLVNPYEAIEPNITAMTALVNDTTIPFVKPLNTPA